MDNIKQQLFGKACLKIFMGEFGSGKTEFAVNYALKLKEQGFNTAIVDLDLVKPYFRVRENRILLENNAVEVVAAADRLESADLPIMPHDLHRALSHRDQQVVIDVGGYKGATVLGQLKDRFDEESYEALLIVNTRRPFTDTVEGIMRVLRDIEAVSRLKVTGLVSNTNLAEETTAENVLQGVRILEEVAKEVSLPLCWVVVPDWLTDKVKAPYPIFRLQRYTKYPWMD